VLIRILEITVPVFGIIALAYFYGRRRPTDLRDANRLNIVIFTPALIFHALTERSSSGEHFLMAAVGAAVIVLGSGMLAWIWVRATRRDPAIYVGPAMFNNCGNLGLPLAILAFGEDALPLAVVLLVTENLLQFTLGLWLLGDSIHIKRLATRACCRLARPRVAAQNCARQGAGRRPQSFCGQVLQRRMARFWAATLRARGHFAAIRRCSTLMVHATRRALRLVLRQNGRWRGVGPNGNTP